MNSTETFTVQFVLWEGCSRIEPGLQRWHEKESEVGELIDKNLAEKRWVFDTLNIRNGPMLQKVEVSTMNWDLSSMLNHTFSKVRLQHLGVQEAQEIDAILCELIATLLDSDLAADLQCLCPTESFKRHPVC